MKDWRTVAADAPSRSTKCGKPVLEVSGVVQVWAIGCLEIRSRETYQGIPDRLIVDNGFRLVYPLSRPVSYVFS